MARLVGRDDGSSGLSSYEAIDLIEDGFDVGIVGQNTSVLTTLLQHQARKAIDTDRSGLVDFVEQ